jgi:hypothetical protein
VTSICPRCGCRNIVAAPSSLRETVHCKGWMHYTGDGPYDRRVPCGRAYALGDNTPANRLRNFMWRVAEFGWQAA